MQIVPEDALELTSSRFLMLHTEADKSMDAFTFASLGGCINMTSRNRANIWRQFKLHGRHEVLTPHAVGAFSWLTKSCSRDGKWAHW